MIIQNVTYKGKTLANSGATTNRIVLQTSSKDLTLDTKVDNLSNYHGATAYYTVAGGRLFSFSGKIFGLTRADRYIGQKWLNDIIQPNGILEDTAEYTLTWTDDGGNQFTTQARVFSMPQYTNDVGSDVIDFTFELFSPSATYQGINSHTANIGWGMYGGALFSNNSSGIKLGTTLMDDTAGSTTIVNNTGEFVAGVVITYTPTSTVGIAMKNLTMNRIYGIATTIKKLIYDSTQRPTAVTADAVDVTGYRTPGSQSILLQPGNNELALSGANNSWDWSITPSTASLQYYDNYIHS